MGCGSSAAGRLAAIALANHFGELGWSSERILEEACALEGHPDNAAACWLGGFVAAASEGRKVHVARVMPPADGGRLWCCPRSRWRRARRGRACRTAIDARRCGGQYPVGGAAGAGVCPGPRRSAAHCHERPDSPALPGADLPAAAAVCCRWREARHSGGGAERSGAGRAGGCRKRGELGAGFGGDSGSGEGLPKPDCAICRFWPREQAWSGDSG